MNETDAIVFCLFVCLLFFFFGGGGCLVLLVLPRSPIIHFTSRDAPPTR